MVLVKDILAWFGQKNTVTTRLLIYICLVWFFLGLNLGLGFSQPLIGLGIVVFTILALWEGYRSSNKEEDDEGVRL